MISRDLTLTVNGKEASLDKEVYLYRGDGTIQFNLKIKELEFKFGGQMKVARNVINSFTRRVEMTVLKPNGDVYTIKSPTMGTTGVSATGSNFYAKPVSAGGFAIGFKSNYTEVSDAVFTINPEDIDEENEVGVFQFQIHLFDAQNHRVTLPPFSIEILDVIGVPQPQPPQPLV